MKKTILLLLLSAGFFSSCEKDDICDGTTVTTPRLVISFYDINNPSVLKNLSRLKVVGEEKTEGLIFNPTATEDSKFVTNGNTISIPLKTNENSTTYQFIFNSGNSNSALTFTDKIEINYTRTTHFISRACGYKTNFVLNPKNAVVHTAVPTTTSRWIQYIEVKNTIIETENETHLKIFF